MKPTYHITGITKNGRRFKIITHNTMHAWGINLWRGTLWEVKDNKRKILKRVYN